MPAQLQQLQANSFAFLREGTSIDFDRIETFSQVKIHFLSLQGEDFLESGGQGKKRKIWLADFPRIHGSRAQETITWTTPRFTGSLATSHHKSHSRNKTEGVPDSISSSPTPPNFEFFCLAVWMGRRGRGGGDSIGGLSCIQQQKKKRFGVARNSISCFSDLG